MESAFQLINFHFLCIKFAQNSIQRYKTTKKWRKSIEMNWIYRKVFCSGKTWNCEIQYNIECTRLYFKVKMSTQLCQCYAFTEIWNVKTWSRYTFCFGICKLRHTLFDLHVFVCLHRCKQTYWAIDFECSSIAWSRLKSIWI